MAHHRGGETSPGFEFTLGWGADPPPAQPLCPASEDGPPKGSAHPSDMWTRGTAGDHPASSQGPRRSFRAELFPFRAHRSRPRIFSPCSAAGGTAFLRGEPRVFAIRTYLAGRSVFITRGPAPLGQKAGHEQEPLPTHGGNAGGGRGRHKQGTGFFPAIAVTQTQQNLPGVTGGALRTTLIPAGGERVGRHPFGPQSPAPHKDANRPIEYCRPQFPVVTGGFSIFNWGHRMRDTNVPGPTNGAGGWPLEPGLRDGPGDERLAEPSGRSCKRRGAYSQGDGSGHRQVIDPMCPKSRCSFQCDQEERSGFLPEAQARWRTGARVQDSTGFPHGSEHKRGGARHPHPKTGHADAASSYAPPGGPLCLD